MKFKLNQDLKTVLVNVLIVVVLFFVIYKSQEGVSGGDISIIIYSLVLGGFHSILAALYVKKFHLILLNVGVIGAVYSICFEMFL